MGCQENEGDKTESKMAFFEIIAKQGRARVGYLNTPHGTIETPAFVPVGTLGAVKGLSGDDLRQIGIQAIIANTYHLHLRPGEDLIHRLGGLHRFMGWDGPLMTDSGGFQLFSLGAGKTHGVGKIGSIFPEARDRGGHFQSEKKRPLVAINEKGAEFTSYLDGSRHSFTPEDVINMQIKLGADIVLVLDECTSPLHDHEYTRAAMARTHRWAIRSLETYQRHPSNRQSLFGIIQGGAFQDLREKSARFMRTHDFHGFAIGGSLGKSKEDMRQVLDWTVPVLPEDRPRHLLGIGMVEDIVEVISRGIDLFDCVAPALMARTGTFLVKGTDRFKLNILNTTYKDDPRPIHKGCACEACTGYSRGYLRHLFIVKEPLGPRLALIHNLWFMETLMSSIRKAIKAKRLESAQKEWLKVWKDKGKSH